MEVSWGRMQCHFQMGFESFWVATCTTEQKLRRELQNNLLVTCMIMSSSSESLQACYLI